MYARLLDRGVYPAAVLSADGNPMLLAVDHAHRLVRRVELLPGDNPYDLLAEMWDYLDSVDPEYSRREVIRNAVA